MLCVSVLFNTKKCKFSNYYFKTGKALDHLRNLDIKKAETYLEIMEEGMGILNELDYPDALTGGLRRYADNARSIIERTRSDITNAFINEALRKDISNINKNEL